MGVKFALRFLESDIPGVLIESLQFGANPAEVLSKINPNLLATC